MEIKIAGGVYSYILKENEWYTVTDEGRQSTIDTLKGAAQDNGCKYAAILVQPDALLSSSPNPRRHVVFQHTFDEIDALKLSVCVVVQINDETYASRDASGRTKLIEAAEREAENFHHSRVDRYPTLWEVKRGLAVLSKGMFQ